MALAHPMIPRRSADVTRWERARVATVVPPKLRPGTPVAHAGEATLRARIRMELLVERARAERRR